MSLVRINEILHRAGAWAGLTSPIRPQTPASPWSTTALSRIVINQLAGLSPATAAVDRALAMRQPSIVKARALIAGILARHPLAAYRGSEQIDTPAWLSNSASGISPWSRMLWTYDDLFFHGSALWALDRDPSGAIIDAMRLPHEWWTIDPQTMRISVHDQAVTADDVALFESPQEGLLTIGRDAIPAAADIEHAWADRVRSPIPMVELHSTDRNSDLEESEAAKLVASWETARAAGGTAYTPAGIALNVHGQVSADLFIGGRNAVRLDVANYFNIPAALLDGSVSVASLTYSTKEGARNELVDYTLGYWAAAVTSRLSMDDISAPGTRVDFDLSALLSLPQQQPTLED